jgi:hypothetical protein
LRIASSELPTIRLAEKTLEACRKSRRFMSSPVSGQAAYS